MHESQRSSWISSEISLDSLCLEPWMTRYNPDSDNSAIQNGYQLVFLQISILSQMSLESDSVRPSVSSVQYCSLDFLISVIQQSLLLLWYSSIVMTMVSLSSISTISKKFSNISSTKEKKKSRHNTDECRPQQWMSSCGKSSNSSLRVLDDFSVNHHSIRVTSSEKMRTENDTSILSDSWIWWASRSYFRLLCYRSCLKYIIHSQKSEIWVNQNSYSSSMRHISYSTMRHRLSSMRWRWSSNLSDPNEWVYFSVLRIR